MRIYLLLLFLYTPIFAQDNYPKDFFRSPLDIPLQLSGNFGELRSNHFHAGLDMRTQQKENLNVYAAGDGYVSRIKISAYGYGKAIYIDHPNGYTTVYGHLNAASPTIQKYIIDSHYKEKSFEIDVFPKPGELLVKKGDMIAYSGNTGGSGGPHLHFEIRDTKSEKIINPMYFGFGDIILDNKKPVITQLIAYPTDENSLVNQTPTPITLNLTATSDGNFTTDKVLASGRIGFGINCYDTQNYSGKNGVFKVETFVNGAPVFGYTFESFAFEDTRFINALIDYPRYKKTSQRIQRLFMKQPYHFPMIQSDASNGIIEIGPNINKICRIELSDYHKNKITVTIPVEYTTPSVSYPQIPPAGYLVYEEKDNNFEKGDFSVFVPARSVYADTYFNFDVTGNTMRFGNDEIPLHKNISVSYTDRITPMEERDKMFIASVSNGKISYNTTKRTGNNFYCYTKNLGEFKMARDTTAPRISISKAVEGKWISSQKTLVFTISDNLAGIKEYKGFLNGNWILFDYDYKSKRLVHDFSTSTFLLEGRNELKLEVTDGVGNSAIFETYFFRSLTP